MATDLGKVGMVMKGEWNSSLTYEVLDAVSYQGGLYIAKQSVPANTAPTNTTYWQTGFKITNQTLDISNIKLEYDTAGSTAPTATLNTTNGASSITRSGNTVKFMFIFNITATGSGNTLKVTGLPEQPINYRTLVLTTGACVPSGSFGIVRKDTSDIVLFDNNGSAINSSGLTTGTLYVGGSYLIS